MAEVPNDYFASVFTVEDTYEIQEITPDQPNWIPLSDCDFIEDSVTKALDKIKISKTPGPDCIAIIFILSLKSGKVPDIWKLANVILIPK